MPFWRCDPSSRSRVRSSLTVRVLTSFPIEAADQLDCGLFVEDGGGALAFANAWLRDRIEMVGGTGRSVRELLAPVATRLYEAQLELVRRTGRGSVCDLTVLPRTRANLHLGVCKEGTCRGWVSGLIIPADPLRLGRGTPRQVTGSPADPAFLPLSVDEYSRLDVLSAREAEVLKLMANGRNSTQIAKSLRITTSTVRAHARRIRKKLRNSSPG